TVLIVKMPARYVKTQPFDNNMSTLRAVRVLKRMPWNVAQVNIIQTNLLRNFMMLLQSLHGGWGQVHHLIIWMESEEVNRRIGAQVVIDPRRQFLRRTQVVSHLRNNKVCNLNVHLRLIPNIE